VRASCGCKDGSGTVGVVFAAGALHAVRRDKLVRDPSGMKPQALKVPAPVMGTATTLHRHDAARGYGRGAVEEWSWRDLLGEHGVLTNDDRTHLVDTLGLTNPDSGNFVHGLPLLIGTSQGKVTLTPSVGRWEGLSYLVEPTCASKPPALAQLRR
jgi:hypothetical protein